MGADLSAQQAETQGQPAEENQNQTGNTGAGTILDPITIYATLNPMAAFDYPGQVSVIEWEDIKTEQPSSVGDLLKTTPGVFVDGGARRTGQDPNIRGFEKENILILLDGVRQNFISGHDGRIFVEPDLLKSVEVVKGPISSLYGSGALGGVIALTTVDASDFLNPGETAGFRLKAGWQSVDDEFLLSSTAFAQTQDGKLGVIGSFSYREAGDIELGNGATLPSEDKIKSALLKSTFEIAPDLKFTGSWIHYLDNGRDPDNPQGNNQAGDNEEGILIQDVYRKVLSDTVSGKLSYAPSDNKLIDGNLLVYWSRNKVEQDYIGTERSNLRDIQTTGVNIDNRSRFELSPSSTLTLTYGAEYYVDRQNGKDTCPLGGANCALDGSGNPIPPASGASEGNVPSGTAAYSGVFAQAEYKVSQPLSLPGEFTLLPGVRWDTFSNEVSGKPDFSDEAVSPKIAASYKPIPWFFVFGNYGEAFRAPTYNELYAIGNHFPMQTFTGGFIYNQFVSNPDLKPQEGQTAEGGAGFEFKDVLRPGDSVKIKGSYWHTDAKNYIDLDVHVNPRCFSPAPIPGFPACGSGLAGGNYSEFVNREQAELDGIEIEARYDSARFYGGIAYATIDGKDNDGDYLTTLQPDKIFVDLGVKVPEIWARFGTRFTFADEMDKVNSPSEKRDAYNLIDLYAVFEPTEGPLKGFRLDLGIDNVTDEAYEVIAANAYEEGINYKAAVSWTYKW